MSDKNRVYYCDCNRYCKVPKQVSSSTFYAHAPHRHRPTTTLSEFTSGRNVPTNDGEAGLSVRRSEEQLNDSGGPISNHVNEGREPKRKRFSRDGAQYWAPTITMTGMTGRILAIYGFGNLFYRTRFYQLLWPWALGVRYLAASDYSAPSHIVYFKMAFKNSSGTNAERSNFWDIGRDQTTQVNIGQIFQTNNAGATAPSLVQPTISHRHMPSCSPLFTGRKNYLDRLEQYFGRDTDQPQRRKRFLLYGLGESQICLKFVERNADRWVSIGLAF